MELSDIKGIGPKRLALFSELNIKTPEDLLRFYPREYLDYTHSTDIRSLVDGERVSVFVTVMSEPTVYYLKGRYIVSLRVSDNTGKATLRWVNQPYRMNQFRIGEKFFANGIVSKKRGVVLYNPQINRSNGGIVPVYPSVKGLSQTLIREAVSEILKDHEMPDILPKEWRDRYHLIEKNEAIREVHLPESTLSLVLAKRRLSFENAFLYFTAIRAMKSDQTRSNGYSFVTESVLTEFLQTIPFTPTDAQLRVLHEVESDMQSKAPMNRLIQGDVGSGKTLIAEFALLIAEKNGKQGVLLAPTELLAEQHFRTLQRRFPNAVLYIGSMKKKEKDLVRKQIELGERSVVIGTHAVLSDSVHFYDLGLAITDEQHRFGVLQRAKIESKGTRPDVLVMSATPIPRTLALLIYADLNLSVIDSLPPGRKPIKTRYVPSDRRKDLYRHIAQCAEDGERTYVVCPLIEPTEGYEGLSLEELYKEISEFLPDTAIGYLHGQMQDSKKIAVMESFRNGTIPILVSTTVVEVGVDVPEATSMVVEGAEHFGLATLHQLRGRVGRGEKQSYCYLLCHKFSQNAKQRLDAMLETNDGFEIAQRDFDLRGSGDLFGVKQSGEGDMQGILSGSTAETIENASKAANEVFMLPSVVYNALLEEANDRYQSLKDISHN